MYNNRRVNTFGMNSHWECLTAHSELTAPWGGHASPFSASKYAHFPGWRHLLASISHYNISWLSTLSVVLEWHFLHTFSIKHSIHFLFTHTRQPVSTKQQVISYSNISSTNNKKPKCVTLNRLHKGYCFQELKKEGWALTPGNAYVRQNFLLLCTHVQIPPKYNKYLILEQKKTF